MDRKPKAFTRGSPGPATASKPSPETGDRPPSPPPTPAAVYEAAKRLQQRIRLALLASRRER